MILFIILVLVNMYIFTQTGKKKVTLEKEEKKWIVYGTMGCGWTRKQLDYLKKVEKPFEFINCDEMTCENITSYPTIVHPSGEQTVGYEEI